MLVLAASRSADSFSIDSLLLRRGRKPNGPSPDFGWPMRLISSIYVLMFFGAAVTKLRNSGIDWGLNALTNIFYQFRGYASPRRAMIIDLFLNHLPMKLVSMSATCRTLRATGADFGNDAGNHPADPDRHATDYLRSHGPRFPSDVRVNPFFRSMERLTSVFLAESTTNCTSVLR
jgi:hypothetical protein